MIGWWESGQVLIDFQNSKCLFGVRWWWIQWLAIFFYLFFFCWFKFKQTVFAAAVETVIFFLSFSSMEIEHANCCLAVLLSAFGVNHHPFQVDQILAFLKRKLHRKDDELRKKTKEIFENKKKIWFRISRARKTQKIQLHFENCFEKLKTKKSFFKKNVLPIAL